MNNDENVEQARREARQAWRMSVIWWVQVPIIVGAYFAVSQGPLAEKLMLCYLAAVSIIANAVSYSGKSKAAEAKAAGYENP